MSELALNPASRPEVRIVGQERTPVVVIDEPLLSVEGLVQDCIAGAAFSAGDGFAYPGIRAPLPKRYSELLAPQLAQLISQVYQPPSAARYELIHQLYSLITLDPAKLQPLQRVPHTDTRHRHYFATVHYLVAGEHGGTGFFRHRPTGYERISDARYPHFVQTASAFMERRGLPTARYINASDDHFELIGEVAHRRNRLVLYPGNLLHSGLINPATDIDPDPATGRLTANLFFYYQ
jgi:hypothetical protein